ncbi:MAG: DUF72 domain-containing protein [Candidatus Omnitrophica bacterium]|nr:DUF72 domain-containing protein [Candidatus Omnitrophota bacterium]
MTKIGKAFIGTSGWFYEHWFGRFYPSGLSKRELLSYYCKYFNTVELNNSFYHLPSENAVNCWRESTGKNFLFSVKASRLITHYRKLKNIDGLLKSFLKRMSLLNGRLGPLLFQLPPAFSKNTYLLKEFLERLPKRLKKSIEFRNESWICKEVFRLLTEFNVAFCIISMPDFPLVFEKTADFAYIRLHGKEMLYGSEYREEELIGFAQKINGFLKNGIDVYIYFNNDANAYAVKNALFLKGILRD